LFCFATIQRAEELRSKRLRVLLMPRGHSRGIGETLATKESVMLKRYWVWHVVGNFRSTRVAVWAETSLAARQQYAANVPGIDYSDCAAKRDNGGL
jgi:hypothetical protein